MNDDELKLVVSADVAKAAADLAGLKDRVREFGQSVVEETAKMVAGFIGVEKAIEGLREGIGKADEIRDLTLSLATFTGSMDKATEAMRFFSEQAAHTRNTAEELGKVFRDLTPLAGSRGFGQQATEQLTLMLSQLSTVSGFSLDAIESGFRRALSGGNLGAGRNPIMAALGFTKEDVDVTWSQFIDRLYSKTKDFDKFGESFASATHKIHDAWEVAFGEGFNNALDNGRKSYTSLLDAFTNPALIEAIGRIGVAVGEVALKLANAATYWNTGKLQQFDPAMPAYSTQNFLLDHILNNNKPELTDYTNDKIRQFGGNKYMFPSLAAPDPQQSKEQFGPYLDAALRGQLIFEAGMQALRDQADSAGKVAISTRKAADAAKEQQAAYEAMLRDVQQYQNVKMAGLGGAAGTDFFHIGSIGLTDTSAVDQQTLAQARASANQMLAMVDPNIDAQTLIEAAKKAGREFSDQAAHELELKIHDQLVGTLSNDFANLFSEGGKHFTATLGKDFKNLVGEGATFFLQQIFGKRGDGQKDYAGNYLPGHDPNQISGGIFSPQGTALANDALGFAGNAANAYGAGQSGVPGSRSSAVVSGAVTGASMLAETGYGAILGAVVGAIVALVGNAAGAAARQKDYLYGQFGFDANGNAKFTREKNLQDAQQQQMIGQVQGTVDSYRNQYTRLLMTLGVGGASPFDPSKIGGSIQDNPSAHFMEHFQEWMSQTLPREIAKQFQGELKGGFGNLGLSGQQFDSMWTKYQGLDPAKAASMMSGLADALTQFRDTSKFFGQSAPSRLSDLKAIGNQTFAQSLDTGDTKILDFASHLKDLVGEDQINAAKELGQMETDRQTAEKQFLQSIIDSIKAAHQAADALNQSLSVRLLHNADGSPDNAALAKYYQSDANSALTALSGAKNPQDAQAAWNRFLGDLDKVSQTGYSIGTSTGDAYTKWAQDQIHNMQPVFDSVLNKMGDDVAKQDAAFLKAIQPSIDAFKNSLGGSNVAIGNFGENANVASSAAASLGASLNSLQATVDRLNRSLSSSKFANSTLEQRVA